MNPLQSYGGNIIAMFSEEDKRLVKDLRREESILRSSVLPSLWTIKRDFITKVRKVREISIKVSRYSFFFSEPYEAFSISLLPVFSDICEIVMKITPVSDISMGAIKNWKSVKKWILREPYVYNSNVLNYAVWQVKYTRIKQKICMFDFE